MAVVARAAGEMNLAPTACPLWRGSIAAPGFAFPVEIEGDGDIVCVEVPGGRVHVALPSADAVVRIDPDGWVLRAR
jgi:hypothetical protein